MAEADATAADATTADALAADALARQILSSAKYGGLDAALVRRIAGEAAQRFGNQAQALKYARRKLHQAFGAFLVGSPVQAVTAVIAAVSSGQADVREAAMSGMRSHASAAQRAGLLVPFYEQVAAWCGEPSSVADLACGLNPLAIPWMRLAPEATYWACEIDGRLVAALAELDPIVPASITATTRDLIASPPKLRADVAFILKTVPTLEQQSKGASSRLLAALDCRHIILSLPRRSITGRLQYANDASALVRKVITGTGYQWTGEATFGDELVCHLARAGHSPR
jgi:16S rRNA (guanine(1405)-N(7))-methyltransferase